MGPKSHTHCTGLKRLTRNKQSSLLGLFLSYEEKEVLWMQQIGHNICGLIFFLTYRWVQKARVLNYLRLERFTMDKQFSLLGLFLSYEEYEVLWMQQIGHNICGLIFFLTYRWDPKSQTRCTWLERFTRDKHSSLLGLFLSYEEYEVLWMQQIGHNICGLIFFITYRWVQKARMLHYFTLETVCKGQTYWGNLKLRRIWSVANMTTEDYIIWKVPLLTNWPHEIL